MIADVSTSPTEPLPALVSHIRRAASQLTSDFEHASELGHGTPQEVADFREGPMREALAKWFPEPYRFTKGQIQDAFGGRSASIDCVMLNPAHPKTIEAEGKHSLILADGVEAAIELKSNLTLAELERGLEQGKTVKVLRRLEHALFTFRMPDAYREDRIQYALRVPFFLFATDGPSPEKLAVQIFEFYRRHGVPAVDQIEAVVIHQRGILFNWSSFIEDPALYDTANDPGGLEWFPHAEDTFMAFLLALCRVDSPVASWSAPVIGKYLSMMSRPEGVRFPRPA